MSGRPASGTLGLWAILRLPVVIFAGTAGGLAAALLGDGAWHVLSWLLLAVPVAIILVVIIKRPRATSLRQPRSGQSGKA